MKDPETIDSGFERTTPEAVGITSASILNLLDTARERNLQMHSLMILRHGKQVAGMWWKPYAPGIPHQLYSFSKSVVSTAVGFAVSEGLLSLDDRVARFFRRRIGEQIDERIYAMTVEHLLTMTSGARMQNETVIFSQIDWVTWFLNTTLNDFPGERFFYNSMNTYMLAAILRQVTGMGLVDYLTPRLFEPLGIARPEWDVCPMGVECGGWGLSMTTEDMARFAQLYLDKGVWHGRQILPAGWAERACAKHVESKGDEKMDNSIHRTSGYGYQFWVNSDGVSYRADGMFGQYGIILPEKDMVIAITAGHPAQMETLDVLWDMFIPQIDAIPEGSRAGGDYDELCAVAQELRLPAPEQKKRCVELERLVSGCQYDFSGNVLSLLPLSVRYLHKIKPLGVESVGFEFGDDISWLLWSEDATLNRIPFRLDGEYCDCELSFAGRAYPATTTAAWTEEGLLEVDIRLVRTAHMQRAMFRFSSDELTYSFDEDPSVEQMVRLLFDIYKPARPLATSMARLVSRIIPGIKGRRRE